MLLPITAPVIELESPNWRLFELEGAYISRAAVRLLFAFPLAFG
ncbi:MAG: hypothetical protein V9G29_11775 [Burkholderiaceae bacterium]